MTKFSIITPVNLWKQERVDHFRSTIKSVEGQTFRDFEWIIADDGSTMEFDWNKELQNISNYRLLHLPHNERVIATQEAFQVANGEWFCLLDSDDEYVPEYLEEVVKMIEDNPKYLMFNFGAKYIHRDGKVTLRDPFEPKMGEVGHVIFGGGNIVNGTFVFHRSIFEHLGGFPGPVVQNVDCSEINYGGVRDLFMQTPFDFSAAAQLEFPELRQFFMVDHVAEPNKIIKELGNPWGNDFFIFYKYTRRYQSKPVKKHLYIVHPR